MNLVGGSARKDVVRQLPPVRTSVTVWPGKTGSLLGRAALGF
jgi:hypothetical protein